MGGNGGVLSPVLSLSAVVIIIIVVVVVVVEAMEY